MARDKIKTQMEECKMISIIFAGILIILVSQQSFANQEKRRFYIKYPGQITAFMNYFNWLESELMSKQIGFDEHAQR